MRPGGSDDIRAPGCDRYVSTHTRTVCRKNISSPCRRAGHQRLRHNSGEVLRQDRLLSDCGRSRQRPQVTPREIELPGVIEPTPLRLQQAACLRNLAHPDMRGSGYGREICEVVFRIGRAWFEQLCTERDDLRRVPMRDRRKQIRPRFVFTRHIAITGAGYNLIRDFLKLGRIQIRRRTVVDIPYRTFPGILRYLRSTPLPTRVNEPQVSRAERIQVVEAATGYGTANFESPSHQAIPKQRAVRGRLDCWTPRRSAVE